MGGKDFSGEKDEIFCGVFDGHGPLGHKVSCHVRDALPSKLSYLLKEPEMVDYYSSSSDEDEDADHVDSSHNEANTQNSFSSFSLWKKCFVKAFKEMDRELYLDSTVDSFCSGSTAVTVLKKGEHLIIANLGDSRAVLCTRNQKNQLVPVQLTVDLKPNLPGEAERIRSYNGRVFAREEEPDVYRLWMADEDCPGLAMSRAFGDFCLKNFGLSSTPKVSYRELAEEDEFVVLATDGVWDVLSNKEVIKIVASAGKRSMAAKLLVRRASRAWKFQHPTAKADDCAAICLFFKSSSSVVRNSWPKMTLRRTDIVSQKKLKAAPARHAGHETTKTKPQTTAEASSEEEWNALKGVSRVNSIVKLPRFSSVKSGKKTSRDQNGQAI
ncbi:PREDICTED: probable protein phosphatase 2C 73 isoform X2 [Nelumbo nucifera]|uniref:Probable protein phosphatase 2C 73 isoform X2 n=1 Tax=Nelumbo nucifera TaxID=4432 RepID=A0A1U8ACD1_NELNU|nr:PREDICTED: probable protein phosphatase 2C 73 isoform X2 [Nelumbo nucifera]